LQGNFIAPGVVFFCSVGVGINKAAPQGLKPAFVSKASCGMAEAMP
jgi:hypothetical protein